MAQTKVENSELDLIINADTPLSALSQQFANLLQLVNRLNIITPMSEYHITRQGSSDVWLFSALTKDARVYTTTIAFIEDEPYYSETSLTLAKLEETRAFLELAEAFVPLLKVNGVSTVDIVWE